MKVLDTVILVKELPDLGLHRGDIGAVVEVYEPDGLEVEFVTASGQTQALAILKKSDVRAAADTDILTVRSQDAA